jgi:hypothetical protein
MSSIRLAAHWRERERASPRLPRSMLRTASRHCRIKKSATDIVL